jgi:hypothetical protein
LFELSLPVVQHRHSLGTNGVPETSFNPSQAARVFGWELSATACMRLNKLIRCSCRCETAAHDNFVQPSIIDQHSRCQRNTVTALTDVPQKLINKVVVNHTITLDRRATERTHHRSGCMVDAGCFMYWDSWQCLDNGLCAGQALQHRIALFAPPGGCPLSLRN